MTNPVSKLMKSLLWTHLDSNLSATWRPAADIYHCNEQWLLKVELAGVKVEDIRLDVNGRQLILRGVRLDHNIPREHVSHAMEIAYNRFERVFEFTSNIETAKIRTEYLDGMLHIYLRTGGNW